MDERGEGRGEKNGCERKKPVVACDEQQMRKGEKRKKKWRDVPISAP